MTRPLVNVRLADDVTEALDRVAARRGLTRSDAIRDAIDAYLADAGESPLAQTIVKPSYSV